MGKKGPRFGTNIHKPDSGECIVIGCVRRGLYRTNSHCHRGYCRLHRDLAVQRASLETVESRIDSYVIASKSAEGER